MTPRLSYSPSVWRALPILLLFGCVKDAPLLDDPEDQGMMVDLGSVDGAVPDVRSPDMRIRPDGPAPRIEATPAAVVFVEGVTERPLTLTNVGDAPLSIGALRVDGSNAFTFIRDGRNALAGALGRLEPGAGLELEVVFRPTGRREEADLVVPSDDPVRPSLTVPITAGVGASCLEVMPAAVEFGDARLGVPSERTVSIENCGDREARLERVSLGGDDPGAFTARLPEPVSLEPGGVHEFVVVFTPDALRPYSATLTVDTDAEPLEVRLLGRGSENICPIPRSGEEAYDIAPEDAVILDGSASVDPDGEVEAWKWLVVEQPLGENAALFESIVPGEPGVGDDDGTPRAAYRPSRPGVHQLELHVTDDEGLSSEACGDGARVVVRVGIAADVRIELTWDGDVDLDLHFLHPRAEVWFEPPYDCSSANPAPDWGVFGQQDDDPELSHDAVEGPRPEVVELSNPEDTEALNAPYLFAVHAFGDRDGLGFPVTARVRVLLEGEVALEMEREMEGQDHFWEVGQITTAPLDAAVRDVYREARP